MYFFKKNRKKCKTNKSEAVTRGLLIYPDTSSVMTVEQILKEEGYDIRVVCPPPQYRTGCDLCVEIQMLDTPEVTKMLGDIGFAPMDVLPVTDDGMKPLELYRTKDFGKYLMVRAANMKITMDKTTNTIVNVSGGGCPDIPQLAREMVGKTLSDAPEPSVIGFSLCAYSLNMAYEELKRIAGGG